MDMMMGKSTIGSVGSGVKEADTVYLLRIQLQDFILIKNGIKDQKDAVITDKHFEVTDTILPIQEKRMSLSDNRKLCMGSL